MYEDRFAGGVERSQRAGARGACPVELSVLMKHTSAWEAMKA